jgi:hypothetical protein
MVQQEFLGLWVPLKGEVHVALELGLGTGVGGVIAHMGQV